MIAPRNARKRAVTLIEILIVLTIITLVTGGAIAAMGQTSSVRLRRSAVMIASAVRVAYSHANAVSKVVRLTFDFQERSITLEESNGVLLVKPNDPTGGAAAATQQEQKALEEAEKILKVPAPPRPTFRAAKAFGFDPENGKKGKLLSDGIRFAQIETGHDDLAVTANRAYVYFWPGGETERAAIQISSSSQPTDADTVTVLVSPLTGKTEIRKGRLAMPRPRDETEESERQDTGF